MNESAPGEQLSRELKRANWSHILPFAIWMAFILLEVELEVIPANAWSYAVRSAAVLAALFILRPWRWYAPVRIGNLLPATIAGIAVFIIWIAPEGPWMDRYPALRDAYLRFAMLWPWSLPDPVEATPYAPEVCGWPLALTRLLGSAVVIAAAEEFFWRGWLYRWLQKRDFRKVDPGNFDPFSFFLTAIFFGLEHQRWLVGLIAGLIYGWLLLRTRDIWAVVFAHFVTNLVLGLYVLASGSYAFW